MIKRTPTPSLNTAEDNSSRACGLAEGAHLQSNLEQFGPTFLLLLGIKFREQV